MPQIINTNIMALNAQRNLNTSQNALRTSLQRLSSGLRINSARDDAAGLAISERFTSQINGLNRANLNANDGVSMSQVAEGALSEAGNILQRVRELAVQSINATNSSTDRAALNAEVKQLTAELDRIAKSAEFNGQKLLNGTAGTSFFQVGANVNQLIVASTANFTAQNYGDYRIAGFGSSVGAFASVAPVAGGSMTRMTAEKLTITSPMGIATVDVADGQTAQTVAGNINLVQARTGVKAYAETDLEMTFNATSSGAYVLTLASDNATAVTISFNLNAGTGVDALNSAAQAFNAFTANTGVVAEVKADGSAVVLHHYEGNNVYLMDTAFTNAGNVTVKGVNMYGASVGTAFSGGAVTVSLVANDNSGTGVVGEGQVYLDSDKSFTVTSNVSAHGLNVLSAISEASILQKVASLDVSTVDQAKLSLAITDSALQQVATQRAQFGALQSRFESAIRNLETSAENMTAARSRVRDADFAVETTGLSRAQILQQAGTAMLAQANSVAQNVLSLLR